MNSLLVDAHGVLAAQWDILTRGHEAILARGAHTMQETAANNSVPAPYTAVLQIEQQASTGGAIQIAGGLCHAQSRAGISGTDGV